MRASSRKKMGRRAIKEETKTERKAHKEEEPKPDSG